METSKNTKKQLLSSDLSGYEKYLKMLGMSERNIEFLKLAPRKLIELLGCFSGLEFLKDRDYKPKFLGYLEHFYKPGQLKKYASGITHYRDYLISIGTLIPYAERLLTFGRIRRDDVVKRYDNTCSQYFKSIENDFLKFLKIERQYCYTEMRKKIRSYRKFALFIAEQNIENFSNVSASSVLEFSQQKTTLISDWNGLKGFLEYGFRQGLTSENLAAAIVPAKYKTRFQKQYLKNSEIEEILNSIDRKTTNGKRTYAYFLLMARLGLRPSEPNRMKLTDVDWSNSRIFIRGKNRVDVWMPMTQDIAAALQDYLRVAKRGNTDKLFVQLRPPHVGFEKTYVFIKALRRAYEKTGIRPPTGEVRLNVFRHSFATTMINSEKHSVFAVQSLLRHKSPSITLHYAKYHSKKLGLFAANWPGVKK